MQTLTFVVAERTPCPYSTQHNIADPFNRRSLPTGTRSSENVVPVCTEHIRVRSLPIVKCLFTHPRASATCIWLIRFLIRAY
jgi:hypothetical protein